MAGWLDRSVLLLGQENIDKLKKSRVAVVGLGGVGGAAAEALCRAGVGSLLLVDHDTVDLTNLNRQLLATTETLGQKKIQAAQKRLKSISPDTEILTADAFYLPENSSFLYEYQSDYVLDAIDTVTSKLHMAQTCFSSGIPLLTCLGTGNRLDPSQLRLGDISETAGCGCPLARVMRRELKKRGVTKQPVVFSVEMPAKTVCPADEESHGRHSPGSVSFVPPVAGYLMASKAVRDLCGIR